MILRDNGLSLYDSERQARRYRVKRAFASFTQQVHPDMTHEIIVSPALYDLLEENAPDVLSGSLEIRVRLEPTLSGTVAHAIGTDGTRRHTFAMRLPGSSLTRAPEPSRAQRYRAWIPVFVRRFFANLRKPSAADLAAPQVVRVDTTDPKTDDAANTPERSRANR